MLKERALEFLRRTVVVAYCTPQRAAWSVTHHKQTVILRIRNSFKGLFFAPQLVDLSLHGCVHPSGAGCVLCSLSLCCLHSGNSRATNRFQQTPTSTQQLRVAGGVFAHRPSYPSHVAIFTLSLTQIDMHARRRWRLEAPNCCMGCRPLLVVGQRRSQTHLGFNAFQGPRSARPQTTYIENKNTKRPQILHTYRPFCPPLVCVRTAGFPLPSDHFFFRRSLLRHVAPCCSKFPCFPGVSLGIYQLSLRKESCWYLRSFSFSGSTNSRKQARNERGHSSPMNRVTTLQAGVQLSLSYPQQQLRRQEASSSLFKKPILADVLLCNMQYIIQHSSLRCSILEQLQAYSRQIGPVLTSKRLAPPPAPSAVAWIFPPDSVAFRKQTQEEEQRQQQEQRKLAGGLVMPPAPEMAGQKIKRVSRVRGLSTHHVTVPFCA